MWGSKQETAVSSGYTRRERNREFVLRARLKTNQGGPGCDLGTLQVYYNHGWMNLCDDYLDDIMLVSVYWTPLGLRVVVRRREGP